MRTHAIRLQLEAVVLLALSGGMCRGEILRLKINDAHYDNAYIVVRKNDTSMREVPFTATARAALHAWLEFRALITPDHDLIWMNSGVKAQSNRP